MRVVSPLADIDFNIGRVTRQGSNLVVESDAASTLETRITVTPGDALATLGRLVRSPGALVFAVCLPFFWLRSRSRQAPAAEWERRRSGTGLNKPW